LDFTPNRLGVMKETASHGNVWQNLLDRAPQCCFEVNYERLNATVWHKTSDRLQHLTVHKANFIICALFTSWPFRPLPL